VRVLHSAGYGTELAGNQKRAFELAARKDIHAAIVVQSRALADLGHELRDKIPTTILLGDRTDETVRPSHALQRADVSLEDALDELLDRLGQPAAPAGGKGDETVPVPVRIEDCKLDLAGYTFVDGSGREVRLTRAETALLAAFVDSPRRVLSRDQLRCAVAGRSAEPYDRSVDMLVARLRRKIEPDPKAPRFILSVPGVGYIFDVRPQSAANGEAPPALERNRSTSPDAERPSRQAHRTRAARTTAATCDNYHRVRRRR
jgi:DNA-binding response OmpR family regulator